MLFLRKRCVHLLDDTTLNTVEQVQDKVEECLIRFGYAKQPKLYFIQSRSYEDSKD